MVKRENANLKILAACFVCPNPSSTDSRKKKSGEDKKTDNDSK